MRMNEKSFFMRENGLSAEAYLNLRRSLDWDVYTLCDVEKGLQNSLYTISIYKQELIVGAGRVVGDGILCFYIQDVMVRPGYQAQGIGHHIMSYIMAYLDKYASPNAYIGLMSKIGKTGFYERYGFVVRPNAVMGPGMVIPEFSGKSEKPHQG